MKSPVAIQMSLANVGDLARSEEVYDFIERNAADVKSYVLDASRVKGRIVAAIEYVLILGVVGSVASIASLLWMAYDKFIGNIKKNSDDTAGLYIAIQDPDGTVTHFWLGNEYKDRDIFIEKFTESVELLRDDESVAEHTQQKVQELEADDLMVRRK